MTVSLYAITDIVVDKMMKLFTNVVKRVAVLSDIFKKTVRKIKVALRKSFWCKMWRIFIQVYPIMLEVVYIIANHENTSFQQIILVICLVISMFYTAYDILKGK